jgi:hypothetical protein
MWLSEQLRLFVSEWNRRPDVSPRSYGMVRLDNDIKVLESFGKRAYARELNSQRTVISDLLGGMHTLLPYPLFMLISNIPVRFSKLFLTGRTIEERPGGQY